MILVSIIIPMYNAEKYISDTINSVINQTYTNWEIIIIDDGSTDNSLFIVRQFESEKIKIITVKNGGAARARNIGFNYTRGEYIQYLDADDLLDKDKISLQINEAKYSQYKSDVIFFGNWLRFKDEITNIIGGMGPGESLEKDFKPLEWLMLRPFNLMTIHSWLTPRSLIEKSQGWLESMTLDDDGEFFIRVIANVSQLVFCKKSIAYYRTDNRNSTLSNQRSILAYESSFQSLETYILIMSTFNEKYESIVNEAIGNNIIYYAYDVYPISRKLYNKALDNPLVQFASINFKYLKKEEFSLKFHFLSWKILKYLKLFKTRFYKFKIYTKLG